MATIEPRSAQVTIYQGDYLDRIRHLEQKAEAAAKAEAGASATLDEASEALDLVEQHDALVKEAEQSALHVRVRALGRKAWKALVADHPPREDNAGDKAMGVNEETFKDELVAASIVEPAMTDGERADFLDAVSDVDFDRLYYSAFALNRAPGGDPKLLGSRLSQKNDETSN